MIGLDQGSTPLLLSSWEAWKHGGKAAQVSPTATHTQRHTGTRVHTCRKVQGSAAVGILRVHPAAAGHQGFCHLAVVCAAPRRHRRLATADGRVVQRRLALRIQLCTREEAGSRQ